MVKKCSQRSGSRRIEMSSCSISLILRPLTLKEMYEKNCGAMFWLSYCTLDVNAPSPPQFAPVNRATAIPANIPRLPTSGESASCICARTQSAALEPALKVYPPSIGVASSGISAWTSMPRCSAIDTASTKCIASTGAGVMALNALPAKRAA